MKIHKESSKNCFWFFWNFWRSQKLSLEFQWIFHPKCYVCPSWGLSLRWACHIPESASPYFVPNNGDHSWDSLHRLSTAGGSDHYLECQKAPSTTTAVQTPPLAGQSSGRVLAPPLPLRPWDPPAEGREHAVLQPQRGEQHGQVPGPRRELPQVGPRAGDYINYNEYKW